LFIVSIFAVIIIIGESEAFKNCKNERKNQPEYRGLYERSGIFGGKIVRLYTRARLSYVCTWHFTEKNEGAIVALATLALSIFTYTLWGGNQSPRRSRYFSSWRYAKLAASR
jgi:hypothetical protein